MGDPGGRRGGYSKESDIRSEWTSQGLEGTMEVITEATTSSNVLQTLSNQMADAVERAGRALVSVSGRPRHPASGIVVAPDQVLTADHVLEREEDLTVTT